MQNPRPAATRSLPSHEWTRITTRKMTIKFNSVAASSEAQRRNSARCASRCGNRAAHRLNAQIRVGPTDLLRQVPEASRLLSPCDPAWDKTLTPGLPSPMPTQYIRPIRRQPQKTPRTLRVAGRDTQSFQGLPTPGGQTLRGSAGEASETFVDAGARPASRRRVSACICPCISRLRDRLRRGSVAIVPSHGHMQPGSEVSGRMASVKLR
ncbi:hypothetical protein C8Q79DRAFT_72140 [Trametes meyenii]|nr:hypothetical protein C8Q79DRAFT_72140 [Trametes meyenii]